MRAEEIEHVKSLSAAELAHEIAAEQYGVPGSQKRLEADAWLQAKTASAQTDSLAKRSAREEETLAIAKDANSIARTASLSATAAAAAASEANTIARSARDTNRRSMWIAIASAAIAAISAVVSIKYGK